MAGVVPEFSMFDQSKPSCVVLGDGANAMSYENLTLAFRALLAMDKPTLFSMGQG